MANIAPQNNTDTGTNIDRNRVLGCLRKRLQHLVRQRIAQLTGEQAFLFENYNEEITNEECIFILELQNKVFAGFSKFTFESISPIFVTNQNDIYE